MRENGYFIIVKPIQKVWDGANLTAVSTISMRYSTDSKWVSSQTVHSINSENIVLDISCHKRAIYLNADLFSH